MAIKPTGAGKSSFELVDRQRIFKDLNLQTGTVFLDAACGTGKYTLEAAVRIGPEGTIYAVDLWREGLTELLARATEGRVPNVWVSVGDIGRRIPLPDSSVDACLLATVLHDLRSDGCEKGALKELRRIIRPAGVLAVVEFKKNADPPGPPVAVRLSETDVQQIVTPFGFGFDHCVDVGPNTFMICFRAAETSRIGPHQ
jgi:ubiquinone/menaquinone biosynthesis C-methylase UbiE